MCPQLISPVNRFATYHFITGIFVGILANAYPAFRFFVLGSAMYVQCLSITELLTTDALAFTVTCVLSSEVFLFLCLFLLSSTCVLSCLITVCFSFFYRICRPCKQSWPRHFRTRREWNQNIDHKVQCYVCCSGCNVCAVQKILRCPHM